MQMNKVYKEALISDARYKVLYGGAGSGKSKVVAQKIVLDMLSDGRYKILCVRKTNKSIKESVFAEIKEVISENDLDAFFKINKTNMSFTCLNGARVITSGLDDVEKLKSIKGINRIWAEEASEISEKDFRQLNLRMRGKNKLGYQIYLTFNPISELHWLKRVFVDVGLDDSYVLKTTYEDNAFLDEAYIKTLIALKEQDYQYYKIYCLGEWGSLGNLVYSNWEKADLSKEVERFDNFYNGLDWGFSSDPTAFVRAHLDQARKKIYIVQDFAHRETHNEDIAKEVKDIIGREIVTCDSSEPRSIAEVCKYGVNAIGAKKGKGSIEHGIKWLQKYRIIVDENCVDTINELSTYKYREDKDGNVLPKPLDKNNHIMDALRYAFEEEMVDSGQWGW